MWHSQAFHNLNKRKEHHNTISYVKLKSTFGLRNKKNINNASPSPISRLTFYPPGMGKETVKLNPLLIFMGWKWEFSVCAFYAKVSRSK